MPEVVDDPAVVVGPDGAVVDAVSVAPADDVVVALSLDFGLLLEPQPAISAMPATTSTARFVRRVNFKRLVSILGTYMTAAFEGGHADTNPSQVPALHRG